MVLTMILICAADWGCAASHMAFTSQLIIREGDRTIRKGDILNMERRGPRLLPFYSRKLPVFGDVWHLIAGLRYLPLAYLAWLTQPWEWMLATAVVNSVGWQILKRVHGKDWPLHRLMG